MKKRILHAVIFGFILCVTLICIVGGVWFFCNTRVKPAFTPDRWYVLPPSEYVHFKDRQEEKVGKWLQGYPYHRSSYMGLLEPSPYTLDEWFEKGKKIDNLEDTLIVFLKENEEISKGVIYEVLFKLGANKSVPILIKSLDNKDLSFAQKDLIVAIVGKYGSANNIKSLCNRIDAIEISQISSDPEKGHLLNLIVALSYLAPDIAQKYLEAIKEDPNFKNLHEPMSHLYADIRERGKLRKQKSP